MRAAGDARDETTDGTPLAGLPEGVPSPNLAKTIAWIDGPKFKSLRQIADRAERGDEIGGELMADVVYEDLGKLLDTIEDLAEMCHRREAAASAEGIIFGRG